ncbi:MAG: tetratricopeptide repeat protein [Rhodospirillales bacterium]
MTQPPDARRFKAGFPVFFRYASAALSTALFMPLCLIGLSWVVPAAAQKLTDPQDREKYGRCIQLTKSNPDAAFEMALAWQDFGGGEPAGHCVAAALMGLRIYDEAARRFEALAQESRSEAAVRAGIFAHAAQAWLMDGNPRRAESVLDGALSLSPDDPALLIDRAVVRAERKNLAKAIEDLNAAINLDSQRAEAYVYRASARRQLKQYEAAEADADKALRIDPRNIEGMLERGMLRRMRGDDAGARADWVKILQIQPNSAAADSARNYLEKMDVKKK